jgi:hypothetical protein
VESPINLSSINDVLDRLRMILQSSHDLPDMTLQQVDFIRNLLNSQRIKAKQQLNFSPSINHISLFRNTSSQPSQLSIMRQKRILNDVVLEDKPQINKRIKS